MGVTDTTRICADQGAASCGQNGRCDGTGACQRYATGTVCRGESCDGATNRFTAAGTCTSGACAIPAPRTCVPYKCAANRCASSCASNTECASPNICQAGSCGKKPNGGLCAKPDECTSGFCAQGVCCGSACAGSCFSCNLPGSVGTCAAVPLGAIDPAGTCKDDGPTSCGNDGTCNGSGACRKYGPTTICAARKCAAGVKTTDATCSGTGTCVPGTQVACAPYVCNTEGTDCFNSCSGTGAAPQCLPPNKCDQAKCGKAGQGQDCTDTSECKTGLFCVDGICCDNACAGACRSCKTAGFVGTCRNLPAGVADSGCPIDAANPCGNTGSCDGTGRCAKSPAQIQCAAAVCTTENSGRLAAFCDGAGACNTPAALLCDNNRCDGGACRPCATDADCLNGKACDTATKICGGKSANGVSCMSNDQCASNACVDGMCCEKVCGECEKCSAGKCAAVANGQTDDSCSDTSICGKTGKCSGGQCERVAAGTVCGATCSGDSKVETVCSGGSCGGTGNTIPCNSFVCLPGPPATCATSCTVATNAGCPAGKVCVGGSQCKNCDPTDNRGCTPPLVCENDMCVMKVALGGMCNAGSECVAGAFCTDNRCCEKMTCGSCEACGASGKCNPVTSAPDPDTCPNETATNKCGKTGCDAAGVCKYADTSVVCSGPTCKNETMVETGRCNGMGACGTPATTMCMPGIKCSGGVCLTMCMSSADCVAPYSCISGMCAKKPLGSGCGGGTECDSGHCADGVCCNAACDQACQACSAMGMCGAVTSAPDPDKCPNEAATCGRKGCDAAGACQIPATSVTCASTCSLDAMTLTETKCDGMGACGPATTMTSCSAMGKTCTAGACM